MDWFFFHLVKNKWKSSILIDVTPYTIRMKERIPEHDTNRHLYGDNELSSKLRKNRQALLNESGVTGNDKN